MKKPGTTPISPRLGAAPKGARDAMSGDLELLNVRRRVLKPPISTQGTEGMKYRYFVSFVYAVYHGEHKDYDNCFLDLESKIGGSEEIDAAQRLVEEKHPRFTSVRILNFTLLD